MLTTAAAMTAANTTTVYSVDAPDKSGIERPFLDYDDALAVANDLATIHGAGTVTIRDFATGRLYATIN